ncbi:MAG: transporter permease [Frankiales bacterium]|nr:transporter permease [Frankiales bacterium]
MSVQGLSSRKVVGMVAYREIHTRVTSRAFVIGNGVILGAIALGLIIGGMVQDHFDKPAKVALVAEMSALKPVLTAPALPVDVVTVDVRTETAARALVVDGTVKVAVVRTKAGYRFITKKTIAPELEAVLDAAVHRDALSRGLVRAGVSPKVLTDAYGAEVGIAAIKPPRKDADERTGLAFAAVGLLYAQLFGNCTAVASGVVEEKLTRIVELVLGAIKPLHLLTGKILGIGAVGLLQLAGYAAVGLGVGSATGIISVSPAALEVFGSTLGWFALGFGFLGVLYAAAGSMVSRQEDVAGATAPLSILIISMFTMAQFMVRNPDSTFASIMSWVPPFSVVLMPLRIASGVASGVQVVGTIAVMLVTTSGLVVVAGKVYQRSILRTGTTFSWKQVLRR